MKKGGKRKETEGKQGLGKTEAKKRAIDYGGPRKEFFASLLREISEKYFPVKDWLLDDYETVGKFMALSTLQNGKLPRIMDPGLLEEVFSDNPDPRPVVKELRKGLDTLGIYQLTSNFLSFIHLFTPQTTPLSVRFVIKILQPNFSEQGSNRQLKESSIYQLFVKYLREVGIQNQDRVRKCGGLNIFVQLLHKLISKFDSDVDCKTTAVHLLNTLDSCISENEENAKMIGKSGAMSLILKMLSQESLEEQDKTQILLTLAHAADIYDENKKYIKECGGITSLIQQLTMTESDELSKTVKYLLQMCVSSDKEMAAKYDENNNVPESEPLVAKMEKMKKQNDLQMLEKINKLDEKLQSMEKEASRREKSVSQMVDSDYQANNERTRSDCSLPLSRRESYVDKPTPITPREKSLLVQLDKERKNKLRLETLNQMLQENMYVCLTHVASKENCNKYASDEKSPSTPVTPGGDARCHTAASTEAKNYPRCLQKGNCSNIEAVGLTEKHSGSFQNPSEQENVSCVYNDENMNVGTDGSAFISHKSIPKNFIKPATYKSQGCINSNPTCSETKNRIFYAEPLNSSQTNISLQQHLSPSKTCDLSAGTSRTIEYPTNITASDDHLQNTGKQKIGEICNKGYQGRVCADSRRTHDSKGRSENSVLPVQKKISHNGQYYCESVNVGEQSSGLSNVNKSLINQSECVEDARNCNDNMQTSSSNRLQHDNNAILNYSENNSSCTENQFRQNQQCVTANIDRVLQIQSSQQNPRLERLSVQNTSMSLNIQQNHDSVRTESKSDVGTNLIDKSNNVNRNYCLKGDNGLGSDTLSKKVKAKRVLLQYAKAVSKSTCTTPSLSKIATGETEVKTSNSSTTTKDIPNKKHQLQQTESETIETNKIQTEDRENNKTEEVNRGIVNAEIENSNSSPQVVTVEKCTPNKTKTTCEDSSDKFVKPSAPRRKFRMTPQLGSGNLPKTAFLKKSNELNSQPEDTDQSDVESESDFKLIRKAKQNKFKKIPENFVSNDDCSASFANHIAQNSKVASANVNKLKSLQNRCSAWSVLPVTPTKQKTVPLRPAFSDCGSRRPAFDSPLSVKSVGKVYRKNALDDSGIHSPGNLLNLSPGAASLAGCQAPLRIGGQLLNSRTYNIALETNPNTCAFHRKLRHLERVHIRQTRKTQKTKGGRLFDSLYSKVKRREGRQKVKRSVYEIESDASQELSPASQSSDENSKSQHYVAKHKRRPRLEYTEEEEQNLLEGVRKMGKSLRQILLTYHFHPSRTAVDLKDKFKSMKKSSENKSTMSSCSSVRSRTFKPFSMCEERRLRRGIQKFGYSWKTILEEFTFSRDRTAEDLRNRWRSMHRRGAS